MNEYALKFYKRPDPHATVGRLFDQCVIEADSQLDAITLATDLRPEYPPGTAFVRLFEGNGVDDAGVASFWHDEVA